MAAGRGEGPPEDTAAPLQALLAGVRSGAIPLSDTLDLASLTTFAFTPITGRVTANPA